VLAEAWWIANTIGEPPHRREGSFALVLHAERYALLLCVGRRSLLTSNIPMGFQCPGPRGDGWGWDRTVTAVNQSRRRAALLTYLHFPKETLCH